MNHVVNHVVNHAVNHAVNHDASRTADAGQGAHTAWQWLAPRNRAELSIGGRAMGTFG
ncbi:hypothetical protein SAVIM338S_07040 [Streptomyces avidinii]